MFWYFIHYTVKPSKLSQPKCFGILYTSYVRIKQEVYRLEKLKGKLVTIPSMFHLCSFIVIRYTVDLNIN